MKRTFFSLFMAAMMVFSFTSCEEEEILATGIKLDQSELSLEVEASVALEATLEPAGAIGDIEWSSSDPSVAAVNDGVVTGLSLGSATIVATTGAFSATCEVEVTPKEIDPNNLPTSLRGSDYYLIHLDETSAGFIDGKIAHDFRPDDTNKFLYVWENTFSAGNPTGLNSYGLAEGWISLVVGNVGWSGAGFFVGTGYGAIDMTNLFNNPDDYVFHIAVKSAQENTSYALIFNDGTAEARVVIGDVAIENVEPYLNFDRDNEWHEIEIPVSYLQQLGVFYNDSFTDVNVMAMLAGGVAGTTVDMDAMFFYKKAE
ncbi:Ig-like domain-containing protein [Pontibacter sp. G13]|uniref:Ig-like domain-containing protein n=1 Tax=Pontibacter sp. G13 TaxID=3074898 RepID=UPI00288B85F4|nr:Ig-like domain-containing protein [Pontibacter sp. G13]WNJ19293.1 Ig-like domain-containing protein [Pontibacter sp. G13]